MKYIITILICVLSFVLWADEDNEENEQFGENKAITAIRNNGEEFKLSKESIQTLGITFSKIKNKNGSNLVKIPVQSLVRYMSFHGIYVYRNGWFKLLKLKLFRKIKNVYEVSVSGIMDNDKLVVTSVGLLRVAHIHAAGGLREVDLD